MSSIYSSSRIPMHTFLSGLQNSSANPEFSITFIRFIPTASGAKRLISGYTALKVTYLALVAGTWS
jgi:hypothetical protein